MAIASIILYVVSGIFLLIASFAFLKAKDVFVMSQILKITNLYIVPLILIAVELEKFSLVSLLKIVVIIVVNIIMNLLITHLIARKAMSNKIIPDTSL